MSQDYSDTFDQDEDLDDVAQEVFLLGLLRAYAEKNGLSQSVLTTEFDPLAAQILMMLDGELLTPEAAPLAH